MTAPDTAALDALLDHAQKSAASILSQNKELTPMWVAECEDGRREVFATPWGNEYEKQAAVDLLRLCFASIGAIRYVFVVEAWTVKMTANSRGDMPGGPPPSAHPDRVECVIVNAEEDAGTQRMRVYPIINRRKYRQVGPPESQCDQAGFSVEGRMAHMLP